MTEQFTLQVHDEDDGREYPAHRWTEYSIEGNGAEAVLYCPKGVSNATFEGRVRAAIDVLNGSDAHDLATVHKVMAIDLAALEDHMDGRVWGVFGDMESKMHGMICDLADALGLPNNERGCCNSRDWSRFLALVRARSEAP